MSENDKIITEESAENAENRNFIYNFIKEDIAPGGQYEGTLSRPSASFFFTPGLASRVSLSNLS